VSLYLAIFDKDKEIAGWVFGHYSDFGYFRETIAAKFQAGQFPVLMNHSDCDGEWSISELPQLQAELRLISDQFKKLPAEAPKNAFEHNKGRWSNANSLYDCFQNVDGENIFEALIILCDEGIQKNMPILFQ
jgi:hypothetical protein